MPYCPECGKKVSITDKRCSKCGTKLSKDLFDDIPNPNDFVSKLNDDTANLKERKHHNIEFALAIITVVLTVLSASQTISNFSINPSENVIGFILFLLLMCVIAAIITRYYAKTGVVILLIFGFILIFCGVLVNPLAIIFYIVTAVATFVLN